MTQSDRSGLPTSAVASQRVLILQNTREDAEAIATLLTAPLPQINWHWVSTEADFLEAIQSPLTLVIIDAHLQPFAADAALARLRQKRPTVPCVVVSDRAIIAAAVAWTKAGATDYVPRYDLSRWATAPQTHQLISAPAPATPPGPDDCRGLLECSQVSIAQAREEQLDGQLRSLILQSLDGAVVVDIRQRIRFVNPAAEELFGRSHEDLLGQMFGFPVVGSDCLEVDTHASTRGPGTAQMRITTIEWDQEPAYLVTFRDITDLKQTESELRRANQELEQQSIQQQEINQKLAEAVEELSVTEEELRRHNEELLTTQQALAEERQRYQDLFELAPDGYVVTDAQGGIQEANQQFVQMMGINQDFPNEVPLPSFIYYQDLERFRSLITQLQQHHQHQTYAFRLRRPKDEFFPAAITVAPIRDRQGQLTGARWIIRDVSDRQRILTELEQRNQELTRVNQLLIQTTADLEQRNRELDQFAYVASHDLKAPLRGIASLSGWLEEDLGDQLTGDSQQHLQLMQKRVQRMQDLINGLLQYSRIGRQKVPLVNVNVATLLREVIDQCSPPPAFQFELVGSMPTFQARRLLLGQAFANLIDNAIKYCDRPDCTITITVTEQDHTYEFSVMDNGKGIPPEYHTKVFSIFQTLQANDQTGMGLALVKKIVETEGGEIWLRSIPGDGATFGFTWPKVPR
ncbi:MAG: PAS domain S-box protein [Elainellaceae cyanobacterium]